MNNKYTRAALLALSVWALSACGGGGDSSPATSAVPAASVPVTPPVGSYALTVNLSGSGSVSSSPSGILCGATCSASYASGTVVTLTASPSTGYAVSWGGACSGSGACTVTLNASSTVTATFTSMTPSTGTHYYVDAALGNDSVADSANSLSRPFRTIARAIWVDDGSQNGRTIAKPGDFIEVRSGTYNENVTIETAGRADAWITLRGYNGERPKLRGTGTGPTVYFYHALCDENVVGTGSGNTDCFASYWLLQGLEIQGSATGEGDGNAIKIDTAKVHLQSNKLCCSAADVVKLVRTANDVEILDNEIWQDTRVTRLYVDYHDTAQNHDITNAQGVDIVGADRTRVAGNYVHDIADIGIYAKGNARNTIFENNRLVNINGDTVIGGPALMLGQSTDYDRLVDGWYESYDGIIRNNVVINATGACFGVSSSFNARIYNNSCYNTGSVIHGSILLSNESEAGTPSQGIEIVNNIIYGSASKPVLVANSNAMSDYTTLTVANNIFYIGSGVPQFYVEDSFGAVSFSSWLTSYHTLTGHADTSRSINPLFSVTTGSTPLMLQTSSPAINTGRPTTLVTRDFIGTSRPVGGTIDVGAYEY
jgi:nitrous oxidase accessory protein NosD